jgi:predicted HTH transcriptional regulator
LLFADFFVWFSVRFYTVWLIHRDYYIEGNLLVSMYDNRVEFMSLGGVMPGVDKVMPLNAPSTAS